MWLKHDLSAVKSFKKKKVRGYRELALSTAIFRSCCGRERMRESSIPFSRSIKDKSATSIAFPYPISRTEAKAPCRTSSLTISYCDVDNANNTGLRALLRGKLAVFLFL